MMKIDIHRDQAVAWKFPLSTHELRLAVQAMLEALQAAGEPGAAEDGNLEITITDDAALASLNGQYLGLRGPTNILAFPEASGGAGGELIISADALAREARLYSETGQTAAPYALRLLAHGLLHLLGHEHGENMDGLAEQALARACPAIQTP